MLQTYGFCYYSRAMPDMLARLYDLPDARRYFQQVAEAGSGQRRVGPRAREPFRRFVTQEFSELRAVESDRAYEKVCGAFLIPGSEVGVYRPLLEMMQKGEL